LETDCWIAMQWRTAPSVPLMGWLTAPSVPLTALMAQLPTTAMKRVTLASAAASMKVLPPAHSTATRPTTHGAIEAMPPTNPTV
jgi:hypothetical protein